VGFSIDGCKPNSGEDRDFLKTLPYFVGDTNIKAQEVVCQEKNIILEIFAQKLTHDIPGRLVAYKKQ
jgi:hypothetical protein